MSNLSFKKPFIEDESLGHKSRRSQILREQPAKAVRLAGWLSFKKSKKNKKSLFPFVAFLSAASHLGAGDIPILVDEIKISFFFLDAALHNFFCHLLFTSPLPKNFVQDNPCGDRRVEGINSSSHGKPDNFRAALFDQSGNPVPLAADDKSGRPLIVTGII